MWRRIPRTRPYTRSAWDNHRSGDERHQQINQDNPTIIEYNNITGDSSDSTMSMGSQAFITQSIAEITDSDNDNTIIQSQNRSTHNRNEHMPTFANVVSHDGRWEVRPTHQGVNKGNSNIENRPQRQNTSILHAVKHEDYVTLYVKNIEWKK